MTTPQAGPAFDARPLTDPVDPEGGRRIRRPSCALEGRRAVSASSIIGIVVLVLMGVIGIPILVTTIVGMVRTPGGSGRPPSACSSSAASP